MSKPNPADELREKITDLIDEFRRENNEGGLGMLDPEPVADAIMQLFRTTIEDCLPEELVNTKDESNSDYFYGYGFNAAIAATREEFARVVG